MLKNLTEKFANLIKNFIDKKKLSDSDIDNIIKKVRKILLDSDVALSTTKYITLNIRNKLTKLEINRKISPGQLIAKMLHEELTEIMGGFDIPKFKFNLNELNIFLFIGLQGVGKTTSIIKLANWLKKKYNKKILLVSCDIYRAAAIQQLKFLSNKNNIDFFDEKSSDINKILKNALTYSKNNSYEFLLVDSAGRLHLDEEMIKELINIESILNPLYTFLVIDGIYGQDALNSSLKFLDKLNISGFIITKMDGDSKGGIILSLKHNTNKMIYFIGTGEKINDLEFFYPNRLSSRILGFGDIDSLIEEVNDKLESKENKVVNNFDLILFKEQINNLLKLGGIKKIIEKLPSGNLLNAKENNLDDKNFLTMIYLIDSMTLKERKYPNIINYSRKKRIAYGAGCSLQDVNKLIKFYEKVSKFSHKENSQFSFLNKFKNKKI